MLRREEELRLSEDVQKAFARVRGKSNGVFDVIELLQAQVAREFGLEEVVGKYILRHAEEYVGVEKAKELSLYRRHNICVDGDLNVGDFAPLERVPKLKAVNDEKTLQVVNLAHMRRPLVLLAGSHT